MKRFVVSFIYLYRWLVSPFLPPTCRFTPTCSRYAISAIECHGVAKGLWMTLKRLLRCNPLNKSAPYYDPVIYPISSTAIDSFSEAPKPDLTRIDSINPANSSRSPKFKRAN